MFCAILTLFPDACRAYLDESILGIAQRTGQLQVELVNIRDFTTDRHRTADDRPFGGGPGMVMKVEPLLAAIRAALRHPIGSLPLGELLEPGLTVVIVHSDISLLQGLVNKAALGLKEITILIDIRGTGAGVRLIITSR